MGWKRFLVIGLSCGLVATMFACGGASITIPDAAPPDDASTGSTA